MQKFASAQVMSKVLVPSGMSRHARRTLAHRHHFDYNVRPGYLYVRSRAISSRCNDNFDEFPADELAKSYKTFVGKPVFVNHHNETHRRARGVVIDAVLHKDANRDGSKDHWVEVLMEVDALRFPRLAAEILSGNIARTSMGCDVAYSICSACNNKATSPAEYCAHIPGAKGIRMYRTTASGKKVGELIRETCYGLKFFENSLLVEPPADPTAYFLGVDARGLDKAATKDERFAEVGLGHDDDGHFVKTHRARSKSYPKLEDIPQDEVERIAATGSLVTAAHAYSWDEIGQMHPHVYGEGNEDSEGIAGAANELAHGREADPEAERSSADDLKFHFKRVKPSQIDHMRQDKGDSRVADAAHGYRNNPDQVPPLVLVHRHGVYQVADGHHRAQAAKDAKVSSVPAYVAYSPHQDEPFGDGSRAPFHGAAKSPAQEPGRRDSRPSGGDGWSQDALFGKETSRKTLTAHFAASGAKEVYADADNAYGLSRCHHTSCGRWLGTGHQAAGDVPYADSRMERAPEPAGEPVAHMLEGARAYNSKLGIEAAHDPDEYRSTNTTADRLKRIGMAYDALPHHDPHAESAFHDMRRQVNEQYDHLTGPMGIKVESVHHDPYETHVEMAHDLSHNKRLQVLSTQSTGGHPFFSNEENDKFRAVHDAFGHGATGRGFDRHGEEAAWKAHAAMFHGPAKQAMTTETRGQNASLIGNGTFRPQKIALLPKDMMRREAALMFEHNAEAGSLTALMQAQAAARLPSEPSEHPWFKTAGLSHHNVINHWDQATPEEKAQGKRWYPDAHHVAKAIAKLDPNITDDKEAAHKGAGVLSAYSPQQGWWANQHNAARSFVDQKAVGKGEGIMVMGSHASAAQRILNGENHQDVLKGPKTQDFAHLIEHGGNDEEGKPSKRVVMDRHALSVAAGRRLNADDVKGFPSSSRKHYEHAAETYRTAAAVLSDREKRTIPPHEVQAVTWLTRQRLNAEGDASPGQKGRNTVQRNQREQWKGLTREHTPGLHDTDPPNSHVSVRQEAVPPFVPSPISGEPPGDPVKHTAYGETKAPQDVDTLREDSCPVCGDRDTYDGTTCSVCGYVAPPQIFQDPDLSVARQMDLRKNVEQFNGPPGMPVDPNQLGPDGQPLGNNPTQQDGGMQDQTGQPGTLPGEVQAEVQPGGDGSPMDQNGLGGGIPDSDGMVPQNPDGSPMNPDQLGPDGQPTQLPGQQPTTPNMVLGPDGQPIGPQPLPADALSGDGKPFNPGPNMPQGPGGPEGPLSPEELGPEGMAPDGQQPDPTRGAGAPGTPGDGVPDLSCPACGFMADATPPVSNDMDTSLIPPTNMATPDGVQAGDICPNCGQGLLMSPGEVTGNNMPPEPGTAVPTA